ncbi:hypothetical protein [Burkholderia gladioli]|uniref:hypothetical protein n=1 Tax=Burkholderia gladioli TaxID=28095 RepID=UPI0016416F8D|nr:hypothetical protein [Burkholderia gladioli]
MGLFGGDGKQESALLTQQLHESEARKKQLAAALKAEREKSQALEIQLGKVNAELVEARRAVARARAKQKASVERANRFKVRLTSSGL